TKVTVYSESKGWAQINYNGRTGYVSSTYLSGSAPSSKPSGSAPAQAKTTAKYVNVNPGSTLNVRSQSSTSGSVIGSLSSGTKVTVYSESKGWAQINYNGRTGYVSSTYLSGSASSSKPSGSVPAQSKTTTKYVNVNPGSTLNVRSQSSTSGSVIGSLSSGTKVTVYSESKGWAQINYNGRTGYVSSTYLSGSAPSSKPSGSVPAQSKTTTKYVNVNPGSTLNVRSQSSTSGSVIGSLSSGTKVTVYSESKGWAQINYNGRTGYISSTYLSGSAPSSKPSGSVPAQEKTTTKYVNVNPGSSLNIRSQGSTISKIIGKLPSGTKVTVYSESKGWAKITANGLSGYVSSDFLTTSSSSGSSADPETGAPVKTIKFVDVNAGSILNVRSKPSTTGQIIDRLTRGTEVAVISETSGWSKISVNGKTGYVSSQYLSATDEKKETVKTTTKYVVSPDASGIAMHKSPTNNSSVIVHVAAGIPVEVYSEENGWAKVKVYNSEGYIQSKFLSASKPESDTEQTGDSVQTRYVSVNPGSNLNMRSKPSLQGTVIAKLPSGTAVQYHSASNGWAKVTVNGKTGYVSTQYLTAGLKEHDKLEDKATEYSYYDLSLDEMVKIQMAANPQTDKQYATYIREDSLRLNSSKSGTVVGGTWNVRSGAGTNFSSLGKVSSGRNLTILSSVKGADGYTWYQVAYNTGWVTAKEDDVRYYLDPDNFINDPVKSLQFVNLSKTTNAQAQEINEKILAGKGILSGKAAAFIEAGKIHGVNELYLISHALLETGNGNSQLAKGVKINGKTVYNMYGIGAYDGAAVQKGAEFAYKAGWFTPEAAIIGGAQFIGRNYISAGQNTLYKMRWNPEAAVANNRATHQYATDIGWAVKQISQIHNLYMLVNSYTLQYDIPVYKKL
ncbi:SH3 domain-containing protein, partial [Siminovitchia sediminis]